MAKELYAFMTDALKPIKTPAAMHAADEGIVVLHSLNAIETANVRLMYRMPNVVHGANDRLPCGPILSRRCQLRIASVRQSSALLMIA